MNAKSGEFFTPGMIELARRASVATVDGPDGDEIKATIMDENPGTLPSVNVNDRYPDGVPVTTMPIGARHTSKAGRAGVPLSGQTLILLDTCRQIVLDITPNVMPQPSKRSDISENALADPNPGRRPFSAGCNANRGSEPPVRRLRAEAPIAPHPKSSEVPQRAIGVPAVADSMRWPRRWRSSAISSCPRVTVGDNL